MITIELTFPQARMILRMCRELISRADDAAWRNMATRIMNKILEQTEVEP